MERRSVISTLLIHRETDISEVLQIDNIFINVSKGLIASKQELEIAFPELSRQKIIKMILTEGKLQIAELERGTTNESLTKDIANIVAEKVLNTTNYTRFSVSVKFINIKI